MKILSLFERFFPMLPSPLMDSFPGAPSIAAKFCYAQNTPAPVKAPSRKHPDKTPCSARLPKKNRSQRNPRDQRAFAASFKQVNPRANNRDVERERDNLRTQILASRDDPDKFKAPYFVLRSHSPIASANGEVDVCKHTPTEKNACEALKAILFDMRRQEPDLSHTDPAPGPCNCKSIYRVSFHVDRKTEAIVFYAEEIPNPHPPGRRISTVSSLSFHSPGTGPLPEKPRSAAQG